MGTAFSVQKLAEQIEITVTSGQVKVIPTETVTSQNREFGADPLPLRAGQTARLDPGKGVSKIEEIDEAQIARKLLWQQKMLAFSGDALEDVIQEFSRYTTVQIHIADEETESIRVGGYFRSDDIAGLLTSLQENFDISAEQTAMNRFTLRKKRD